MGESGSAAHFNFGRFNFGRLPVDVIVGDDFARPLFSRGAAASPLMRWQTAYQY
jgi:hypothetical protein